MVWGVLKRVFARPWYVLLAFLVAALTLSALLLLPNREVLADVLFSSSLGWFTKVSFVLSLYGYLGTNFTVFTAIYTVVISLLLGINVSLLWYYGARARRLSRADHTLSFAGIGGFISGLFGIGCAACGTILLAGVFKLLGITWLITYLPLHGAEFGIVGAVLLGLTSYLLAKRINDPLVCELGEPAVQS